MKVSGYSIMIRIYYNEQSCEFDTPEEASMFNAMVIWPFPCEWNADTQEEGYRFLQLCGYYDYGFDLEKK